MAANLLPRSEFPKDVLQLWQAAASNTPPETFAASAPWSLGSSTTQISAVLIPVSKSSFQRYTVTLLGS